MIVITYIFERIPSTDFLYKIILLPDFSHFK